jgi:hypothetical protein
MPFNAAFVGVLNVSRCKLEMPEYILMFLNQKKAGL